MSVINCGARLIHTEETMEPIKENKFWSKAKLAFRQAGEVIALEAAKAWYVANSPATPAEAKAILYGALAYFILPFDAIPDGLPVIGFTDDLAVLTAAIRVTNQYMTEEVLMQARASVKRFLG